MSRVRCLLERLDYIERSWKKFDEDVSELWEEYTKTKGGCRFFWEWDWDYTSAPEPPELMTREQFKAHLFAILKAEEVETLRYLKRLGLDYGTVKVLKKIHKKRLL